jgi:hypothetical protein
LTRDNSAKKMHRIDTAEYGQGAGSKSSAGACNFRGNVMESLQHTLQKHALGHNVHVKHNATQKELSRPWW